MGHHSYFAVGVQGAIEDARALMAKGKIYGVSSKAAEHIPPVSWVREGRTRGTKNTLTSLRLLGNV